MKIIGKTLLTILLIALSPLSILVGAVAGIYGYCKEGYKLIIK